jgi:hypothetical protein
MTNSTVTGCFANHSNALVSLVGSNSNSIVGNSVENTNYVVAGADAPKFNLVSSNSYTSNAVDAEVDSANSVSRRQWRTITSVTANNSIPYQTGTIPVPEGVFRDRPVGVIFTTISDTDSKYTLSYRFNASTATSIAYSYYRTDGATMTSGNTTEFAVFASE